MKKRICLCGLISAGIILLAGCNAAKPTATSTYSNTGTYFDTVITITLYNADEVPLIQDCFDMADRYEKLFSRTIPESDVSRINDAGGEYVTVDEETVELIREGLNYCELTDGAFDITAGALTDLWDIRNNPGIIPDESDIASALSTIGYEYIDIQGNQVALTHEGTMLDLGAIAKGYIADHMKSYLTEQGVTSAMINLGGNVLVIGTKPDQTSYNIGIQYPFEETNSVIASVSVSDQSVVSSGNYERYFELDGTIYHHIMDLTSGYPVDNHLSGVTIITDRSVDGDGLSTSCFVLGLEKGMELIEQTEHTEAVFITDDDELHCSSGINTDIPLTSYE